MQSHTTIDKVTSSIDVIFNHRYKHLILLHGAQREPQLKINLTGKCEVSCIPRLLQHPVHPVRTSSSAPQRPVLTD